MSEPASTRLFGADLPASWGLTEMGAIATVVGGSTPKSKEPRYWDGDIPWLGVADLTGYERKLISGGARAITKEGFQSCATQMLPKGAVVFSSRAPIGYVAIAERPLCTSQGFKSFVLARSMSSDFVYWYLRAAKPIAEALASGTTFKELSGKAAVRIPIPVAPRTEQDRIVTALESLLTRIDLGLESLGQVGGLDVASLALTQMDAMAIQLKRSVLQRAFTGRLVAQDPGEGTGQELLERLIVEKTEAEEAVRTDRKNARATSKTAA